MIEDKFDKMSNKEHFDYILKSWNNSFEVNENMKKSLIQYLFDMVGFMRKKNRMRLLRLLKKIESSKSIIDDDCYEMADRIIENNCKVVLGL